MQMPVFKSSLKIQFRKGSLLGCKLQAKPVHWNFLKQKGVVSLKKLTKTKPTNSASNLKKNVDIAKLKLE